MGNYFLQHLCWFYAKKCAETRLIELPLCAIALHPVHDFPCRLQDLLLWQQFFCIQACERQQCHDVSKLSTLLQADVHAVLEVQSGLLHVFGQKQLAME